MSAASGTTHADLIIDLNGNTIMFDTFDNEKASAGATYALYLKDFSNGNFKLKDTSVLDLNSVFVNDDNFTGSDLFWSNVADANGYYSLNVVPEPAEWAMIFGAVALAFVAYRRRR